MLCELRLMILVLCYRFCVLYLVTFASWLLYLYWWFVCYGLCFDFVGVFGCLVVCEVFSCYDKIMGLVFAGWLLLCTLRF